MSSTAMKAIFSSNHAEIIGEIWAGMPDLQKEILFRSIAEGLKESGVPESPEGIPFTEVVRASWALGFHYCMICMEQGGLVKAGPVKVQNN
jgi:hypothetical protein